MIPQQAVMKDALDEARCSNELLEHLEHLHETNDLFGNVAKSQGHIHVQRKSLPIILFAGKCRQSASKVCANLIESPSADPGTLPRTIFRSAGLLRIVRLVRTFFQTAGTDPNGMMAK